MTWRPLGALIAWFIASSLMLAAAAAAVDAVAPAGVAPASLERSNIAGTEVLIATIDTRAWPGCIVRAADQAAFLATPEHVLLNGGYFTAAAAAPAGLVLENGTAWGTRQHAKPYSGFVWADASGSVHIDGGDQPPAAARWAIQSGPILVEPGGVLGIRSTGASAPRTVLALRIPGACEVVSTGSVTLKDLALSLIARGVERAINLDGGPSRDLHFRNLQAQHEQAAQALVPYYLGFAPAR